MYFVSILQNIVERICSFSQRAFESICILSASGIVLTAELLRPGSASSILRYEGQFEIVSLSGSHLNNGGNGKICRLSVQLAYPNGTLFGGAVANSLIAGGPVQVVIATFRENLVGEQQHLPARRFVEPSDPNNVYVPLVQTSNGQVQDGEQVPPVDAPSYNGVDRLTNHRDVNRASPQQFDWNNNSSLQSCSTMSQHLFSRLNNTDE
ncbi:PREDICTED: AT-hook motif nuclear-localized protein 7-like [Erythranthe guttata]|uniref:AT-hook motif nuclear-localized protein 7-like n=1 Tax=Erythranthe guttata TaxID=4155 RepID=UPI00064D751B|nr:PREDICTED: AT-hook motif nuclear-localized protein 7-like [Erythranthe guttata]|eukprot:XP_012838563.1 PREDICTED: AT-hook motif nuclear-localized protein 7-like [Erythranthe guttata]